MDMPKGRSDSGEYRVVLSYAVAGITVRDGRIVDAAPILAWTIGKSFKWFQFWVRQKSGTVEPEA